MRYLFILLFIPFLGFSQTDSYYSNGARRPHIRVDSLTANKTDSIKIGNKMFYATPPTLTEAGDIVHLGHLNTALAGKQGTITGAATTIVSSNLTANDVAITDASGKIAASTIVSTAELNFLDNAASNIQTQLNGKQSTITGGATSITSSNLAADFALISNVSGKVAVSTVSANQLGYLEGVTSNIQTQFAGKANLSGATFTGDISVPDEAYGVGWDASVEVPTKNSLYDKIETIISAGSLYDIQLSDGSGGFITEDANTFDYNVATNEFRACCQVELGFSHDVTGTNGMAAGQDNYVSGPWGIALGREDSVINSYGLAVNYQTKAGLRSFAGGGNTVALGDRSFNFGWGLGGLGALASNSAILGGNGHTIESGNTNAAIIGGSAINLTGTNYIDYTVVDNFAIFSSPATGTGSDSLLVWDATDKKVKKVMPGSGAVTSVFTRTGAVVATAGDYTAAQVTNAFDKTVDDAADVTYTPTTTADWPGTDPDDVAQALDSLAKWIGVRTFFDSGSGSSSFDIDLDFIPDNTVTTIEAHAIAIRSDNGAGAIYKGLITARRTTGNIVPIEKIDISISSEDVNFGLNITGINPNQYVMRSSISDASTWTTYVWFKVRRITN